MTRQKLRLDRNHTKLDHAEHWASWFNGTGVSKDYMQSRDQPRDTTDSITNDEEDDYWSEIAMERLKNPDRYIKVEIDDL